METEHEESEKQMNEFKEQFAADIIEGMSQTPKKMYSKYFYDERGDELFQSIMKMDEYYLTAAEYEIFSMQKENMMADMKLTDGPFQLIEFGAGDGYKTKVLLRFLLENGIEFEYVPIDISSTVLQQLESSLNEELPELKVRTISKDYFKALEDLQDNKVRKVILFLGSNIGNFSMDNASGFLSQISDRMNEDDLLLMGVDLKKDPNVILAAYNDENGITRAFNLNLLNRINQELGGDFDIFNFEHFPIYDPVSGTTKSYLISKREQTVCLSAIDLQIQLEAGEPIDMETSQKYSVKDLERLADQSGFKVEKNYYDCKHFFTDTLWRKK